MKWKELFTRAVKFCVTGGLNTIIDLCVTTLLNSVLKLPLFVAQIIGIVVTIAVAIVGTLVCLAIVRIFTELRVDEKEEKIGLDISEHGESAYPTFNGLDS